MSYLFYTKLGLSLGILLLFIIMRRLTQRLALRLLRKKELRFYDFLDELSVTLEGPFNFMWLVTGGYIALATSPFIHFPNKAQPLLWLSESLSLSLDFISFATLNQGYGTLIIIGLTWTCYNFVAVYEKVLIHIGSKFTLLDNALIIRFTSKIIKFLIILIGITVIVAQYINLAGILTSVGLAGAAVTFIAKDTLTNIMSGVVLMVDKPFTIGDWIEISNLEGIVEDVSFRSTRIRTFEQGLIVVPNSVLSNDNIINWSMMPKRRCRFNIAITYETSKEQLNTFIIAIQSLLDSIEGIEKDTSMVFFDHFGDFSLNILIQYFSLETSYKPYCLIKEKVNLELMALAEKHQIIMAFPTQTIQLEHRNLSSMLSQEL